MRLSCLSVQLLLLAALAGPAAAGPPAADEHGSLVLHFLGQPVGEERYDLVRDASGGTVLHADFSYSERTSTIPLSATLRLAPDLTPLSFESKGCSYRPFSVDATVSVDADGRTASVTQDGVSRRVVLPARFFTLSGYNPLSVQMMMLHYWLAHGRPARLPQLPAWPQADVQIAQVGTDTVTAAGRPVRLTRYAVGNVVWGRESIWLDGDGRIAAAATYAGGLPLEAVAPEYEASFAQLRHAADADRLHELQALSDAIPPLAKGRFAIVGARLIDGVHDQAVEDSVVVVDDGRITAAGPRGKVAVPAGVRVIDGHGQTLLPGLWEMHAHFAQVDYGPAYLAAGVTTARDLGGEWDFVTAERDLINSGRGLGPHMLLGCLVDGGGKGAFGTIYATTPEEGRAVVRRCKAAGFVQMKIYDLIRPEVLTAITAEAHRLGMTVTGHIPHGLDAIQGVEHGMDQVNHFGYIEHVARAADPAETLRIDSPGVQKVIAFFRDHHTVIDPTQSWGELLGRPRNVPIASFEPGYAKAPYTLASVIGTSGAPPSNRTDWGMSADTAALLKALYDAGVPIVAGTDKALPAHSLHRELELYVKAGLTPMQVIKLATSGSARVMGLQGEVGAVAPGQRADLVMVSGDPLTDFTALRRVSRVVTNGRMYDPAPLWKSVGFEP